MATAIKSHPVTLRQTFSFYVPGNDPKRIQACAEQADAVVVSGRLGPASVRKLRENGWNGTVLFDGAAYAETVSGNMDAERWLDEQRSAAADRLLTPGCWVEGQRGHRPFAAQIDAEVKLAEANDATCVLAVDRHWLTRSSSFDEMFATLLQMELPVALVLADRDDPLGYPRCRRHVGCPDSTSGELEHFALRPRGDRRSRLRCRARFDRAEDDASPLCPSRRTGSRDP